MLSLLQILEIRGQGCLPVCSLDSFRKQTIRLPKTVIFFGCGERERGLLHLLVDPGSLLFCKMCVCE